MDSGVIDDILGIADVQRTLFEDNPLTGDHDTIPSSPVRGFGLFEENSILFGHDISALSAGDESMLFSSPERSVSDTSAWCSSPISDSQMSLVSSASSASSIAEEAADNVVRNVLNEVTKCIQMGEKRWHYIAMYQLLKNLGVSREAMETRSNMIEAIHKLAVADRCYLTQSELMYLRYIDTKDNIWLYESCRALIKFINEVPVEVLVQNYMAHQFVLCEALHAFVIADDLICALKILESVSTGPFEAVNTKKEALTERVMMYKEPVAWIAHTYMSESVGASVIVWTTGACSSSSSSSSRKSRESECKMNFEIVYGDCFAGIKAAARIVPKNSRVVLLPVLWGVPVLEVSMRPDWRLMPYLCRPKTLVSAIVSTPVSSVEEGIMCVRRHHTNIEVMSADGKCINRLLLA